MEMETWRAGGEVAVSPAAVFYFGASVPSDYGTSANESTTHGTAFYSDDVSEHERFSAAYKDANVSSRSQFCREHPVSAFCGGPNLNFGSARELFRISAAPNRLILYPKDLLHNAVIDDPSVPLPCSAQTGRLAISLFFGSREGHQLLPPSSPPRANKETLRVAVHATRSTNGDFHFAVPDTESEGSG